MDPILVIASLGAIALFLYRIQPLAKFVTGGLMVLGVIATKDVLLVIVITGGTLLIGMIAKFVSQGLGAFDRPVRDNETSTIG